MARSKLSPKTLHDRIVRALQTGSTTKALELARQLERQQPNEANRSLLRDALIRHGLEQQQHGQFKNAAADFLAAAELGGDATFRASLANRLAGCGKLTEAQALFKDQPDDPLRTAQILGHAADFAMQHGHSGRAVLPAELHAALTQTELAWGHVEAGRDEEARTALQAIGLQSPFLEWKVFLRGLLAMYAGENARALENWQRLDAKRLPSRLAAPLMYHLDPEFRKNVTAIPQATLHDHSVILFGSPLIRRLQEIRSALTKDNLAPAFRLAEKLLPELKRDFPDLVPRLGACFTWAIIEQGMPEDLDRFLRVFGAPADDPTLHRVKALALETRELFRDAHKVWQAYLKELEHSREWTPEAGKRARALIWARMGQNALPAQRLRTTRQRLNIFEMYQELQGKVPLKPTPEECFRKSIELAPDRLEPYLALFAMHRKAKETAKARKAGQELLKRFPEHAATLEALGDLALEEHNVVNACNYFAGALKANPLERDLRLKLARTRQNLALELTRAKKYDEARAEYRQAQALWEGPQTPLLCSWALLERKAGRAEDERALLEQASAEPARRLAVPYLLMCEAVRAKLSPAERKILVEAFETELTRQPPTPLEILNLLQAAAAQREDRLEAITGQKTREKALLKFLDAIPFTSFDEPQTLQLCESLLALQARPPLLRCLKNAESRFPNSPAFLLLYVDYCLSSRSPEGQVFTIRQVLEQARRLTESMPRGEGQQQILEEIQARQNRARELNASHLDGFNPLVDFINFGFSDEDDDE